MDIRVTSVLLVLLAVVEATPERYYHVQKVAKHAYPTKTQSKSFYVLVKREAGQLFTMLNEYISFI